MTAPWPRAGQRVRVQVQETAEQLVAVVDDVRVPDGLDLREPVTGTGAPAAPVDDGAGLRLSWTSPAGWHVVRARLHSRPHDRVPLWRLVPDGAPDVVQRRAFARAPETLHGTLHHDGQVWPALLCDLGEGGARCLVHGDAPAAGTAAVLHVDVDGEPLQLPATVLAADALGDGRTALRLSFVPAPRTADVLRRRVLAQQRRARAVAR